MGNIIRFARKYFVPNFAARRRVQTFETKQGSLNAKGFIFKDKQFLHYSDLEPDQTAIRRFGGPEIFFMTVLGALVLGGFLLSWQKTLLVIVIILTTLYFLDLLFNLYLIYRSFEKNPEIKIGPEALAELRDSELPVYTILCPLYKEWQVLPDFVNGIARLDYPKYKLQVLLLLEENDQKTIEVARSFNLPSYFQILITPDSLPKTKPKACNFGLLYAQGDYLVIYDAEDQPEPSQLKYAYLAFKQADPEVGCIQAKLNFYNPRQNLITRLFTAEYSLWFDLVLTGLQSINAPIPLGGTSNHFRTEVLQDLCGWDAFNVTEDCDLGMRLAKFGYRTAIIDSTTYEEANSEPKNWVRQRTRWIKGYIQTYFVHLRQPAKFWEGNKANFVAFQLIVGGKVLSMFINPLMWVVTILYFVFRSVAGPVIQPFFPGPVLYMGVFSLIFGNFLYTYYYMIGCAKRDQYDLVKYAFLVPFYWLAMSAAAWIGLSSFIINPHYWAKTKHGLYLRAIDRPSSAPRRAVGMRPKGVA